MDSQLGKLCETLLQITGKIEEMSIKVMSDSQEIQETLLKIQHLQGVSGPCKGTIDALNQAVYRCHAAAKTLSDARHVSKRFIQINWAPVSYSLNHGHRPRILHGDAAIDSRTVRDRLLTDRDWVAVEYFGGLDENKEKRILALDFGCAFFSKDDPLWKFIQKVPGYRTTDGQPEYIVGIHGTSISVGLDRHSLTPEGFAVVLEEKTAWAQFRNPIRLISCLTGEDGSQFAQQLADHLGVPVTAPTKLAWCFPNEGPEIREPEVSDIRWSLESGEWTRSPDSEGEQGKWVTFKPRPEC